MWFFPWLYYATAPAIIATLVSMYVVANSRSQLLLSLVGRGLTLLACGLNHRFQAACSAE
ncbi:hypothetical protein ACNPQM_07240 [Streptomyces sp. NPDC056231]|uniref:hypothetical protein n=1 Tax=Streptomyces sp. NPDC056231 TaxID=3345755 RepID=UPI003AAD7C61